MSETLQPIAVCKPCKPCDEGETMQPASKSQMLVAMSIFNEAQELEDEGNIGEAVNMYMYLATAVRSGEALEVETEDPEESESDNDAEDDELDLPPLELVGSTALNAVGGHLLDSDQYSKSKSAFEDALEMFPENTMALVSDCSTQHALFA